MDIEDDTSLGSEFHAFATRLLNKLRDLLFLHLDFRIFTLGHLVLDEYSSSRFADLTSTSSIMVLYTMSFSIYHERGN